MLKDIETRAELEKLLTEFYAVAVTDAKIGHYFTRVVQLDLATHLPVIVNFWEKMLFGKPVYFGNPMIVHYHLHEKSPFEQEHFDRWLEIFTATVDRLFQGEIADKAKAKAETVARGMFAALNQTSSVKTSLPSR
jgi:hemoglobin